MKSLTYIKAGWPNRILWGIVYLLVATNVTLVAYATGSGIQSHYLPAGSISLEVPYSKYLVGDNIEFKITNKYNSAVYINNSCPSEPLGVYRYENNQWTRVHDKADVKDCPSEDRQVEVPANGSITGSFKPWHNLFSTPGKYRIVAFVDYYNSLPHQDFEVINKPAIPEIPAIIPKPTSNTSRPSSSSSNSNNDNEPSEQEPPTSTSSSGTTNTSSTNSKTVSISTGSVAVNYTSTTITVLSVTPASGYTYEINRTTGSSIQITFKKSGQEVQLTLYMSGGTLKQSVETD